MSYQYSEMSQSIIRVLHATRDYYERQQVLTDEDKRDYNICMKRLAGYERERIEGEAAILEQQKKEAEKTLQQLMEVKPQQPEESLHDVAKRIVREITDEGCYVDGTTTIGSGSVIDAKEDIYCLMIDDMHINGKDPHPYFKFMTVEDVNRWSPKFRNVSGISETLSKLAKFIYPGVKIPTNSLPGGNEGEIKVIVRGDVSLDSSKGKTSFLMGDLNIGPIVKSVLEMPSARIKKISISVDNSYIHSIRLSKDYAYEPFKGKHYKTLDLRVNDFRVDFKSNNLKCLCAVEIEVEARESGFFSEVSLDIPDLSGLTMEDSSFDEVQGFAIDSDANYKGSLNNYAMTKRLHLSYDTESWGLSHLRKFQSTVYIKGGTSKESFKGDPAVTKMAAEQSAAKYAWRFYNQPQPIPTSYARPDPKWKKKPDYDELSWECGGGKIIYVRYYGEHNEVSFVSYDLGLQPGEGYMSRTDAAKMFSQAIE